LIEVALAKLASAAADAARLLVQQGTVSKDVHHEF
jgi:hypothetical protein